MRNFEIERKMYEVAKELIEKEILLVGVTTGNGDVLFVKLNELQPYHWTKASSNDELEKFVDKN